MSSIHTQMVRLGTGPGQGTNPVSAENPLPVAGSVSINSGTKVAAVADLAAGGTGLTGWLSQIWSALSGTLAVSGPVTNAEIRASALQISASQLPETLGGKTAAQSLAVTLSADGPFSQNFGATSDAAATTDAGTFSLLALVKRGMQNWSSLLARLPASLGAKTAAASLSIAPASDATFPVTVGQITSTTTTIASGQSVSGNIDLGLMRLGRIVMPTTASGWDAANLTLQTSHDGVTFNNLHDKDGAEYTITATSGRSILVPLADMLSVRYFRIRSGTSAAAVNQTASRTLTLVLVP